jgi:DNA-binding FrmR family transcriptional regulator
MTHNKEKTIIALKKAQTLMAKVMQMAEDDKYCVDIIQQNLAIIGLLKSANLSLLEGHMDHCVKNAAKANDSKRLNEMMAEMVTIMKIAQNK